MVLSHIPTQLPLSDPSDPIVVDWSVPWTLRRYGQYYDPTVRETETKKGSLKALVIY